ncbi:MAG: hypothetical protein H6659_11680 [Ardenticatenaceae bacterium]|nr:hypothetical protein [Ardenticatenaceae bacterium]
MRQSFPSRVEQRLRQQDAAGTAVLAVLPEECALSRAEIITVCRDYLLEQAILDSPADCVPLPTDNDLAIALLRLVDLGVMKIITMRKWPLGRR